MYLEISNPMDYDVGLYIRLSREDDNDGPSESVSNQLSLLTQFARERHLNIFDTYIDDGWSGTNFDRPSFQRLIQDIEAKKINMVITKDLSRLGRDYIMVGYYMEKYFPEKQVRYISLLDGVDTGVESTANDITPFRAIMNDLYAKDISKKIRSVKHDKQRKGLFIGSKAVYGYKKDPNDCNKLIIDEAAAPIVRRIFRMAASGVSCHQIAVTLNDEKIPTPAAYAGLTPYRAGPYAGKWSSERISEMLRNEVYIGNMVQGKSVKVNYKSKRAIRQPRENWIIVKNTHEPLIDLNTFKTVNMLLSGRKKTRTRTYNFLLKGLIVCHECGHPLSVINRKNARGEDRLYFMCRTYQRFTKAGVCTSHSISESKVTNAVMNKVKEACAGCLDYEALTPIAAQKIQKINEAKNSLQQEPALIQSKIENITAQIDKLYSDRLNGILDSGDFSRIYQRLKDERMRLEELLSRLLSARAAAEYSAVDDKCDKAKELVKKFIDTACVNKELLVNLIERVELTQDKKVIIKFRFKRLA